MGSETGARRVAGSVLAAGRSERMGRAKSLLHVGDRTFLASCVAALRDGGCAPVIAVVPGTMEAEAARAAGAEVVEGRPEGEQVDSLVAGLDALPPDAQAVVVLPVDHPLVDPATVAAVLAAGADAPDALVRPLHDGRPGHPTLFPRAAWDRLRDRDLPRGARSVVESGELPVVDLPVDDPGVTADIDTPAAYRRHLGGDPA